MKLSRLALVLTGVNLALLLLALTEVRASGAQAITPVLRARAIELVDERGQVRSRLNVEPDGEVVLRLLDHKGTIRVKLGASEHGSGLVLLDEQTEPAVHLIARRSGTTSHPNPTSLSLTGADGQRTVIKPSR